MGALGFAVAGGLEGLGEGMAAEAEAARERAMMRLKEQYRQDEIRQRREWQLEDRAAEQQFETSEREARHAERMEEIGARKAPSGRRGLGGGRGGGSGPAKLPDLSSGMLSRIERRFKDPNTGEVNYGVSDRVIEGMRAYMAENPGVSEDQAYTAVTGGMLYEDEVTEGGDDWIPFNEKTRKEMNREGRGEFRGFDMNRNGVPDSEERAQGVDPTRQEAPAATKGEKAPAAKKPSGDSAAILEEARQAIAAGAPRDKVIARLREMGIDPEGL